tara:strand:+ start:5660 stop:7429 length:1770 start_codon:yes stop_codon:yes gene_type:complete
MYIEIAQNDPRSRNTLIPKGDLAKYIQPEVPLYRSVYLYDEAAKGKIEESATVSSYYGERYIDKILIDVDKGDNSDEETLRRALVCVHALSDLDVHVNSSIQPYFSGTGYHLVLSNDTFNFAPSENLPYIVKQTMANLLPGIDEMVYIRTAIYRVAHTVNKKTGLYKVPLTIQELMHKRPNEIMEIAKTPRLDFPYQELMGDGELEEYIITDTPKLKVFSKTVENIKVVPCIQRMLTIGPQQGNRNNTSMRLASHFRRNGIPSEFAKAALLHWNNKSLDESVLIDKIEQTYNKGYQYGCNDELLLKHCQTKCIYFKHKDYTIDVKNVEDLQAEFHERMITNFEGRSIDLSKMFHLPNGMDCTIYPGELVTIFGPTGSSKTTFAQNIALGVDFAENKIVPEWQIPTLFLSLELSAWYMHRRHLQIVSGLNKEDVTRNYQDVYEAHKDKLGHLVIQTISPTLEQIQNKIRKLQPAVVIVDYIDLVETPKKGEYEQIKYISHSLSNMAVNNDLIIIQISQVAREYSRNEVLDLYAGKGSGAIENASRKVIGLNGQANSTVKKVQLFKNTDGELFDTELEWRPSFRLGKVDID